MNNSQIKEHAVVGVSPFVSYFTEKNIINVIKYTASNFEKFNVFIPDTLPIYNFLSIGYSFEEAKSKTKRQFNYLRNKVFKSFQYLGYDFNYIGNSLIVMDDLFNNKYYINLIDKFFNLYNINEEFKNECDQFSLDVLSGSHDINIAVKYLLYEMPLFMNSPEIFGVKSSTFIYYNTPKFIKYIFNKKIVSPFQSYLEFK